MAGETAKFGLRKRAVTPAAHKFDLSPRLKAMLGRAEGELATPFRGIVLGDGATGDRIAPGLFAPGRTGVPLGALVEAARSFLEALTPDQRKAASFPIDDGAWRGWSNIHAFLMRHGVCLAELDGDQRERALALLREAMSATGFRSARDVMRLNEHILEITGSTQEYGEWLYWVSLFGTPSPDEPWGFQVDGHHLVVNCFALGDQLVLTP